MAMAGAAVGGVASAIGGGIAASKMAKAQKQIAEMNIASQTRIHEASAADREKYSQMSRADADIAQQNLLASEQAQVSIMGALGTSGTYGPSAGSASGPINLGILEPTGLGGLSGGGGGLLTSGAQSRFGRVTRKDVSIGGAGKKGKWKGKREWEVSGPQLDAEAIARQVKGTAGFRTVSGMVAEAEQLQNRQGPLWEQLNNSIVGSVYESSAGFQRDAMEQVARNMAQGGTARRMGMQMASAMQVQEKVNRQRTGELWQAKTRLEEFRSQQVKSTTTFAQNWASNEAGIRDSFAAGLNQLQMHWSKTMAPTLAGATVGAQSATQQGVLNASQGLYSALQTKNSAIQGGITALTGLAESVMGSVMGDGLASSGPKSFSSGSTGTLPKNVL